MRSSSASYVGLRLRQLLLLSFSHASPNVLWFVPNEEFWKGVHNTQFVPTLTKDPENLNFCVPWCDEYKIQNHFLSALQFGRWFIFKMNEKFALELYICLTLSWIFPFTPSLIFIKSSWLLIKNGSLLQVYFSNFLFQLSNSDIDWENEIFLLFE